MYALAREEEEATWGFVIACSHELALCGAPAVYDTMPTHALWKVHLMAASVVEVWAKDLSGSLS